MLTKCACVRVRVLADLCGLACDAGTFGLHCPRPIQGAKDLFFFASPGDAGRPMHFPGTAYGLSRMSLIKVHGSWGRGGAGAGVYGSLGKWALVPESGVSYSGLGPCSPCVGD